jgi:carbon monoxide dehydrogenase subunit G
MELVNDFTVNAPIDETWATLTDLEKIAPCMPGAQLTEIEGETYRGLVKVKVGPITAQFKGQAHFLERDENAHRAALKAEGRDTGGKGNASAVITAQLASVSDASTKVVVTTDLTITGKVAQFGRGALADVSDKLLKQFVHNLETTVLNEPAGGGETPIAGSPDVEATTSAETAAPAPDTETASPTTATSPAATLTAPTTPDPTTAATTMPAPTAATAASVAATSGPAVRTIEGKPVEPINLLEAAGGTMLKRLAPLGLLVIIAFIVLRRRRS